MFRELRALLMRLARSSPSPDSAPSDPPSPASAPLVAGPPPGLGVGPPVDDQADAPLTEEGLPLLAVAAASTATPPEVAQAQGLLAEGKLAEAIGLVQAAAQRQPHPELAAALAELQTIRRAHKRLRRRPDDAHAHLELGRALFAQERGEEALTHLARASRLRPHWIEPHLLCAYEWHWQGRWREAEAAYQAVLALDPLHPTARRGLTAVRLFTPPDALMPDAAEGAPIAAYRP